MSDAFTYEGADLESMDLADNYHRWVLDNFEPWIGSSVVEVGAGIGSISRLIAERSTPQRLFLIEPDEPQGALLEKNAQAIDLPATAFTGFLSGAAETVREFAPDTFVYVNVFEHVEDDVAEFERIHELLESGGTLCVFVPALRFLYSDFDRSIDHYRRYSRAELRTKAEDAGFVVERLRYFDIVGVLPWLIRFRLLGSKSLSPGAVKIFDRVVVPVMKRVERIIAPPIGKNLVLVARKR